jgi:hypothetical protein
LVLLFANGCEKTKTWQPSSAQSFKHKSHGSTHIVAEQRGVVVEGRGVRKRLDEAKEKRLEIEWRRQVEELAQVFPFRTCMCRLACSTNTDKRFHHACWPPL